MADWLHHNGKIPPQNRIRFWYFFDPHIAEGRFVSKKNFAKTRREREREKLYLWGHQKTEPGAASLNMKRRLTLWSRFGFVIITVSPLLPPAFGKGYFIFSNTDWIFTELPESCFVLGCILPLMPLVHSITMTRLHYEILHWGWTALYVISSSLNATITVRPHMSHAVSLGVPDHSGIVCSCERIYTHSVHINVENIEKTCFNFLMGGTIQNI